MQPVMIPEVIEASIELFHTLALRAERKEESVSGDFDPATFFDKPVALQTEDEAQSIAAERTEKFRRILAARNEHPGTHTPYLALGYDLIESAAR